MARKDEEATLAQLLKDAHEALERNDAEAAKKTIDQISEQGPEHPELGDLLEILIEVRIYSQAMTMAAQGRYDAVGRLIRQFPPASVGGPREAELRRMMAEWVDERAAEAEEFEEAGNWRAAQQTWNLIADADLDNRRAQRRARQARIEFLSKQARNFMRKHDWVNAITKWDDVLFEDPENDRAQRGKDAALRFRAAEKRRDNLVKVGIAAILLVSASVYVFLVYVPEQRSITERKDEIREAVAEKEWDEAEERINELLRKTEPTLDVRLWRQRIRIGREQTLTEEERMARRDSMFAAEQRAIEERRMTRQARVDSILAVRRRELESVKEMVDEAVALGPNVPELGDVYYEEYSRYLKEVKKAREESLWNARQARIEAEWVAQQRREADSLARARARGDG